MQGVVLFPSLLPCWGRSSSNSIRVEVSRRCIHKKNVSNRVLFPFDVYACSLRVYSAVHKFPWLDTSACGVSVRQYGELGRDHKHQSIVWRVLSFGMKLRYASRLFCRFGRVLVKTDNPVSLKRCCPPQQHGWFLPCSLNE